MRKCLDGDACVDLVDDTGEDSFEFGTAQGIEQDDLVDTVQEFRAQVVFKLRQHVFLLAKGVHVLVVEPEVALVGQPLGTDVGREDDDGITEVHFVARSR